MTRAFFVAKILGLLVSVFAGNATAQTTERERLEQPTPNIVLVFIDDMGWADFSCFGNKQTKTQHIDQMAKEGIRFHQFYVNSPICSPSRVAISTGMYPQRFRIGSYLASRKQNRNRGIANWLDPKAPMLARILHESGYATGHFGKWHMGGQRDVADAPLISEYGFDKSLTNFEGLGDRVLPLKDKYDGRPPVKHALGSDKLGHGKITWEKRDLVTKAFVERAVEFIDEAQEAGKPFYINVWPDDVHSPFFPPQARRGDESKQTLYQGVLDTMDEQLGVLFARLRNDKELSQNTIVIICSDNGPEPGAGSAGDLRGFKTHLYEGGVRSPLIVWAPGLMAAKAKGAINRESVIAAMDLVPSLLKMAKVDVPESTAFDGLEMQRELLGFSNKSRDRSLFFRRPPDRDSFYGVRNLPDLAVRQGKWKLLCEYDGSRKELYDLSKDRQEKTNLAKTNTEVANRLAKQVIAWHESLPGDNGSQFVKPKSISLFDGTSFAGWEGDTKNAFRIERGTIAAGSKETRFPRNEFLATTREFENFELELKFKIDGDKHVNAGVQFRTKRIPDHHEVIGYQADIGPGYFGHLYDESRRRRMLASPTKEKVARALKAVGKDGWHRYRIRANGNRIQLWLNEIKTVDFVEKDSKISRKGIIALQIHGGMQAVIAYKDIFLTELPAKKTK